MSRKDIVGAILKGIKKAQSDYALMSGKRMAEGPEYWATVHVARSLWKLTGDKTVFLEEGSSDLLDKAGRKRGRRRQATEGKLYDIVLNFANGNPRAVIEMKNSQMVGALVKDAERIVAALSKSELLFGAVGYSRVDKGNKTRSARQKAKSYADEVCEKISEAVGRQFVVTQHTSTKADGDHAWLAGCIMIERKQGNAQKK